jgi:hypothetical protein
MNLGDLVSSFCKTKDEFKKGGLTKGDVCRFFAKTLDIFLSLNRREMHLGLLLNNPNSKEGKDHVIMVLLRCDSNYYERQQKIKFY